MGEGSTDTGLQERAALHDRSFYAADLDDVFDVFAQLRREAPVYWNETGRFWIISKYADQRYVLSNPALFANGYGQEVQDNYPPELVAPRLPPWAQTALATQQMNQMETRALVARARMSVGGFENARFLPTLDPPEHTEYRRVLTSAVSPSFIRGLRPRVEKITDHVLGSIKPGSTLDFMTHVAVRIPATLIVDLMGIPTDQQAEFIDYVKIFMESLDLDPIREPEKAMRVGATCQQLAARLGELLEHRRESPHDDLISKVAQAEIDGQPVSYVDGVVFLVILLTGSIDTSGMLLGQMTQALASRPDQRALVLDNRELIPNAVEEVLRYCPIAWNDCRTATERVEIRGCVIDKGDYLVLPLQSASRDEDVWVHPQRFDVTRSLDSGHQGFGAGVHTCVGAPLARLEGRIVLEQMLDRFPNWEVVGEPVRCISMVVNGLEHLDVRFLP